MFVNLSAENYPTLAAAEEAGASVLRHGNFIQTVVDFLIIAFAIFMVVKAMNSAKKKKKQRHRLRHQQIRYCLKKFEIC